MEIVRDIQFLRLSFLDQSLRELPLRLGPNQILKAIKRKQEVNLTVKDPQLQRRLFGGGFFGEFEWMPDAYDNCKLSCPNQ